MSAPPTVKRFYKSVSVVVRDDGFEIRLDDKPLKSKWKEVLLAPTRALADAIRDEWDAQGEALDLAANPLSNLLAEAIDADAADQWRDDILGYLKSDLVCYRAETPAALAERQAAQWDPYLDWLREDLGAVLVVTAGVIAAPQPDIAIDSVCKALDGASRETLAALRKATAITGSAVMALALWKGAFAPADIFDASLVDENFQIEQWGEDDEAHARREIIRGEFMAIARFLALLKNR